jgi:hypothetical protein
VKTPSTYIKKLFEAPVCQWLKITDFS